MHPSSLEEAVEQLVKLGMNPERGLALVNIVGPTYAVDVYRTFLLGCDRFPDEITDKISEIEGETLTSIPVLNRRLRMLGLRILSVAPVPPSARVATRACHGLQFLAGLDPSP